MGVVRDITVEQLISAIGDIDTSGLAKDTTLQATNTALGNINTTLGGITTNDPPTDTTQQSIASAITALGSTLGSDKANIDGSNIGNKETFRQNIGLVAEEKTLAIAQGVTNITSKVMKYGNVVSIVATLQKVMVLNQYNRLATLPSDCLPPTTLRFYGVNGTKSTHIFVQISATSGIIEVEALPATADATAQNIMIAISYITP